jgi:hypothetical protein
MILGLRMLIELVTVLKHHAAKVAGEFFHAAHMTLAILVLRELLVAVEGSIARATFKHGLVNGIVSVTLHRRFGGKRHIAVGARVNLAGVTIEVHLAVAIGSDSGHTVFT